MRSVHSFLSTTFSATLLACLPFTSLYAAETPSWGYSGDSTPEHWGALDPHFATCFAGQNQSPIDIDHATHTQHSPLSITMGTGRYKVVHDGHTIDVLPENGSPTQLVLEGDVYTLKQFHFHNPSEYTFNGKHFPLEGHFMFMHDHQRLVVSVAYDSGKPRDGVEAFIHQLNNVPHVETALEEPFNIEALFPSSLSYYRFSGSLTFPPCSEGVIWLVLKHPVHLSASQLTMVEQAIGQRNNRPTQPLNGRVIVD